MYKGFWVAEQFYSPTLINLSIVTVTTLMFLPEIKVWICCIKWDHPLLRITTRYLPRKWIVILDFYIHSLITPWFSHLLIPISTCSMQAIFLLWIFFLLPVWKTWLSCFRTITFFCLWKAASAVKNTDNFLPSGTLDPFMLIYIYIAPFIPEDPNALYKFLLSVHRSCTNRQATQTDTGSHRQPLKHIPLPVFPAHSWQSSSARPAAHQGGKHGSVI